VLIKPTEVLKRSAVSTAVETDRDYNFDDVPTTGNVPNHQGIVDFVRKTAELTKPDAIYYCDGSDREWTELIDLMVESGTVIRLNDQARPNSIYCRTDPDDVARVENQTFICSAKEEDAGPTNNWMEPNEMKQILNPLFDGSMRGRTMYVIPFCMGPIDAPDPKFGVELSDSPYVVVSMKIMTRMGAEALAKMNERIIEVEKTREGASAELREQVRSMVAMNESLRRETSALSTALRAPQVRGAWGEQSLKRIVEMSGLVERCDFFQQTSARTDDGLFRPDLTIHLAGGKRVFVDSKAPLTALLDAYGTDDEALQAQHLKRFGKLVRSHVDDLSKKNYWALDAGSPEFVVMFLASEEIFHAALQEQPDLLEYAGSKQIVLASPSTLIGLLKTVAHGWKQAVLAESAEQVSSLGRELFDRISKLGDHFDGVGRALTQATTAYNKTVGSLEGRVMVTARKFNELEVTQAALPSVRVVKEVVRPLTAVELLDAPDELPVAEQAELRRALPSIDDLVEGTTPEEQPNRAAR